MLLYDDIKQRGYSIPNCPVFEISNVAQFCYDAKEFLEWGDKELLRISDAFPPFETFFMEYKQIEEGRSLTSKQGYLWKCSLIPGGAWSCEIAQYHSFGQEGRKIAVMVANKSEKYETLQHNVLGVEPIFEKHIFLTTEGNLVIDKSLYSGPRYKDWSEEEKQQDMASQLLPCLQALMFLSMHSRSVQIFENLPSRQVRRYADRTGGKLPTVFKILTVKGINQAANKEGNNKGNTSFHICRGHRMKATAEHPLFGKPWGIGIFWVIAHTKGKKENGTIEKIYEVSESLIKENSK